MNCLTPIAFFRHFPELEISFQDVLKMTDSTRTQKKMDAVYQNMWGFEIKWKEVGPKIDLIKGELTQKFTINMNLLKGSWTKDWPNKERVDPMIDIINGSL